MRRIAAEVLGRAARAPAGPGSSGELVFAGPLPPAPTGVATYDRAVLDGLRRIGFFERHRMDVLWPIEPKDTPRLPGYRLGIFQLGNNVEFHLEIYRAAFLTPALVVLHDLALDDFVRGLKTLGEPLGYMAEREAMALRRNLTSPDIARNEPLRDPWCAHVARRARGPDRPQRVREAVPAGDGLPHAGLRRAAPHGGVGGGHGAGDGARPRAACAARGRRHAHPGGGTRGPEPGQAARRAAGRRGEPRSVRPRGLGGASHHGVRHRRAWWRARAWASE